MPDSPELHESPEAFADALLASAAAMGDIARRAARDAELVAQAERAADADAPAAAALARAEAGALADVAAAAELAANAAAKIFRAAGAPDAIAEVARVIPSVEADLAHAKRRLRAAGAERSGTSD